MKNKKNMIKFVVASVILILICATSMGTATLTKISNEKTSRDRYTHTVLIEVVPIILVYMILSMWR